ncbi:MAG: 2-isopropylmalate synthase, partial [Erysipelotrichaceae bacterium]|nr:2-isopropylmalate synthase [Erysipelotrichaceae bacterium]
MSTIIQPSKTIKIFDTTLRDGEQSPGCSMTLKEKIDLAKQLERMKVDIIEAGFAIASPGDFESVQAIAKECRETTVTSLARALEKDIDCAWEAIKFAKRPRIHTFIATSDIHMQYKLKMEPERVLEQAIAMVRYAKHFCEDIEFSAEDATRSNHDFLCRIYEAVIEAGATVINVPDTVGYTTPMEYTQLIHTLREKVNGIHKVDISVHCHNDLGLAVANSLAAVKAGATQVECTVNGIGERAGNAALEEIVMGLATRYDYYGVKSDIDTLQIARSSKLLTAITGIAVQPNKAIVGANAFAHESGIHQHGMLANASTYEIMTPESVGLRTNAMVLGKHSGRHAFEDRLKTLGYDLNKDEINRAFDDFKKLADKKKTVDDRDIEALIQDDVMNLTEHNKYQLDRFIINSGNTITSTATIALSFDGKHFEEVSAGDGPVDASYKAI